MLSRGFSELKGLKEDNGSKRVLEEFRGVAGFQKGLQGLQKDLRRF